MILLLLLTIIGIIGGYLLFRSDIVRKYLIRTAARQLETITGRPAEVGNLELSPWPLHAKFYNITLHGGDELPNQLPLFHVDTLDIHPDIRGLLHRTIALNEVVLDHPVLHFFVSSQGKHIIQQWAPLKSGKTAKRFNVTIGRFFLHNGEVDYDNQRMPVDANVHDLGVQISLDSYTRSYNGFITYTKGRLRYGTFASLGHTLTAHFSGMPSHISVQSLRIAVGASIIDIHGQIRELSDPVIEGDYDIRIHPEDFRIKSPFIGVTGDIRLTGTARYTDVTKHSFLRNISLTGEMTSERIRRIWPRYRFELRKLHGKYELSGGRLQARDFTAELLGGHATAELSVEHLEIKPAYRIKVSVLGVDLQILEDVFIAPRIKSANLSGVLDGTATSSWTGKISNAIVDGDFRVHTPVAGNYDNRVPVEGSTHFSYDIMRNFVRLAQTSFRFAGIQMAVQGEASDHSDLQIYAATSDLHQVGRLMTAFGVGTPAGMEMYGSAVLHAVMTGSLHAPTFRGQLSGHNFSRQRWRWVRAEIPFELDPSHIGVRGASLVSVSQGSVSLSGNVELRAWAYFPSSPISIGFSLARIPVTDLEAIANLSYPISGELSAEASFHGSALDPLGSGTAQISNGRICGEPVKQFRLQFRADGGSVSTDFKIGSVAGSATGTLAYAPRTTAYALHLNAPELVLQELHEVRARHLPVEGMVNVSVVGEGTLHTPQLDAIVDVSRAQFRQTPISQLRGEAHIANHKANVEIVSQWAAASVHLHGFVALNGDYYSEASLDTGILPIDKLPDLHLPFSTKDVQGHTELHAMMKGPLRHLSQIEAHVTVPTLIANYKSVEIGNATPIRIEYARSFLTLLPCEFRGSRSSSFRLQASMPVGAIAAMHINAQGTLDAALLSLLDPALKSSGLVSFDLRTGRSSENPSVTGQIHFQDLALSTTTAPIAIEHLSGLLEVENNRVRVSSLSGDIGSGTLSIVGSIAYWPTLQLHLACETKSVRLWYAGGIMVLLDSNLALTGNSQSSYLSGRVVLDKVSFTPDFDLKSLGERFLESTTPQQAGSGDSVKLAVALQSNDRLRASSSQASLEGNVNLQLIGTLANPVLIGRTDLSSGELFYRGRRYQLQRGIVVFNDHSETKPALDVSVTTTVQQYDLTMVLRGPVEKLSTSYTSHPPLPTADVINLIAFGRTAQTADVSGTDAVLASQVAGQVSTRLQSLTGVSGLHIDPLMGGNNRDPSARIGVQQRVTKNFVFSFSTDVSQPNGETIKGEYQINKNWSIGAGRDPVGGVSVEGRHRTKF